MIVHPQLVTAAHTQHGVELWNLRCGHVTPVTYWMPTPCGRLVPVMNVAIVCPVCWRNVHRRSQQERDR